MGRLAVEILKELTTVLDNARVSVLESLSVTSTVKFSVTVAEGVPEISPVEPFSDSPSGREPEAMDHV